MKRLILSLATAVLVASPMLAATGAYAGARDDRGGAASDHRRFDGHTDNGYYLGNRWYWGPPRNSYYSRGDFRLAHHDWARGGRVPMDYPVVVISDYGRYNLRRPPRGYRWVRVDNNFVLEAIATGIILDVLASR